jgi:type II secretory pathway pseudopilin PulG
MKVNSESGFSLLELVVALLMTIGILGAVFAIMNRNQEIFVTESNVTDMNQNIRIAVDMLTRDIQSAGMGLPRDNGSFAAIFYTDGASNAPDSLMILNGDPYAPWTYVNSRAAGSAEFFCTIPNGVTITGSGSNVQFTYQGPDGSPKPIYKAYNTDPKLYICYDDTKAMVFALTQDGMITGSGSSQMLKLQHNPSNYMNPPSVFGTTLDVGEPDYSKSRIAMLASMVAYRLNGATHELERAEDLKNYYSVARGITDFQVRYRIISKDALGNFIETMTSAPTERRYIRGVEITITAETPDLDPGQKGYRQAIQRFEVAPRNFNLLNNTSLSSNLHMQ